ncbi:MAG: hypothetical protein ACLVJ6_09765 [Merdibacter sp.]
MVRRYLFLATSLICRMRSQPQMLWMQKITRLQLGSIRNRLNAARTTEESSAEQISNAIASLSAAQAALETRASTRQWLRCRLLSQTLNTERSVHERGICRCRRSDPGRKRTDR